MTYTMFSTRTAVVTELNSADVIVLIDLTKPRPFGKEKNSNISLFRLLERH